MQIIENTRTRSFLIEFFRHFSIAMFTFAKALRRATRPCVLGEKELAFDPEKPRQYPVEFSTSTLDTDQFSIALPPGYAPEQMPPPVNISDSFLSYKSETKLVGNVLQYTRSYELKTAVVAVKDLPQLKRDFQAISVDERQLAVLHHTSP